MSWGDATCELAVLSGKGGTGKTSVTASLAALAGQVVVADCDVEASNLPLVLDPRLRRSEAFSAGLRARINPDRCVACGRCAEVCRFEAILGDGPGNELAPRTYRVDPAACEGCGVCHDHCPARAIELLANESGEWMVSDTRFGPLVHARLHPGQGNTGKLVSLVRRQARLVAGDAGRRLILLDGPPGIGCPAIACLTGVTRVLAVTEPTPSGAHDLERILATVSHFRVPALACINKADLNPERAAAIEAFCAASDIEVVGKLPYDGVVTKAMVQGQPVTAYRSEGRMAAALREMWACIARRLRNGG